MYLRIFPDISIPTKISILGKIQVTFGQSTIGNKYLGENITVFDLTGFPESLTVVSIDTKQNSSSAKDNICIPIKESLLHTSVRELVQSNNLCDWVPLNTVLLPPLLMEAVILGGETY